MKILTFTSRILGGEPQTHLFLGLSTTPDEELRCELGITWENYQSLHLAMVSQTYAVHQGPLRDKLQEFLPKKQYAAAFDILNCIHHNPELADLGKTYASVGSCYTSSVKVIDITVPEVEALKNAAYGILENWSTGDLAGATRNLSDAVHLFPDPLLDIAA
jgi:hypothetical protein